MQYRVPPSRSTTPTGLGFWSSEILALGQAATTALVNWFLTETPLTGPNTKAESLYR